MLDPKLQKQLDKKLRELKKAQDLAKMDDIKRLNLDKDGDAKWERYKKKMLKRLDRYYNWEFRASRRTYRNLLLNKKSF